MSNKLLLCGVAVSAMAFGITATPAQAQSATEETASTADTSSNAVVDDDSIIVTARRREESIDKVPAAITAFTSADLVEKGIKRYDDLQYNTPSLTIAGSFGHSFGGYSIRGLGANLFGQPTVASYFAEVSTLTPNVGGSLFDVENVQVLKGPQGTLFGRASTAGAVLVTPARPELDVFDAGIRGAVGNYNLAEVEAFVNLPLADDLAARFSVKRQSRDGYTSVIGSGQKLDGIGNMAVRGSLNWEPAGSGFTNYSLVEYDRIEQSAGSSILSGYNSSFSLYNLPDSSSAYGPLYGSILFGSYCSAAASYGWSSDVTTCQNERLDTLAAYKPELQAEMGRLATGGDDAVRQAYANTDIPLIDNAENWSFINTSTMDLGDLGFSDVSLKNIFGFQMARSITSLDLSAIPTGLLEAAFSNGYGAASNQSGSDPVVGIGPYTHMFSNEFQISGSYDDDTLIWLVGVYYQKIPVTESLSGVRNLSRAFSGAFTVNGGWSSAYGYNYGGYEQQVGEFGQFTLDLTKMGLEGIHFTAGIRATQDKTVVETLPVSLDYTTGEFSPGNTVSTSKSSSEGVGWTLALDAQVTDNLMVYATARRGYNPGGQNLVVAASELPNYSDTYEPEIVRDVEIGGKWAFTLAGRRGSLGLAAYRQNYDNIQRTFTGTVEGANVAYTGNVAKARLQGVELEGNIFLTPDLEISAQYSLNDAKYTKWYGTDPFGVATIGSSECLAESTDTACIIDLTDNPFAGNARNKGSVTIRYHLPIESSVGDVNLSVTGYAQSRVYFMEAANRAVNLLGDDLRDGVSQPGFALLNARLEWNNVMDSNFSLALFAQNLTDKTYAMSGTSTLFSLGTATKSYAAPRTWGLQFSYAM